MLVYQRVMYGYESKPCTSGEHQNRWKKMFVHLQKYGTFGFWPIPKTVRWSQLSILSLDGKRKWTQKFINQHVLNCFMCWFLEEYTRNTIGYNVGKAMLNHSLHKDINYQQIAGYCSTNTNKFQTCRFRRHDRVKRIRIVSFVQWQVHTLTTQSSPRPESVAQLIWMVAAVVLWWLWI